jgi:hypothetical protein
MAEGQEAVTYHQSNCKKPRASRPFTLEAKVQWPSSIKMLTFLTQVTNSRRKFGSVRNGNTNYSRETVGFFSIKNQSLTRSWPLDRRDCSGQGIKWDAPLGLAFRGFTLCLAKKTPVPRFHWLSTSNPFLRTLNKVWSLNPTASQPGRP